jgi:hypothetical protein
LQTKHTRKWTFTGEDEIMFKKVKELVCKSVRDGISRLQLKRDLVLMSDWSKMGTRFALYLIICKCAEKVET